MQTFYDNLMVVGAIVLDDPENGFQGGEISIRSMDGNITANGTPLLTANSEIHWNKVVGAPSFSVDWGSITNIPSQISDFGVTEFYLNITDMAVPGGVATLDMSGKLSADQCPSKLITDVFIVASETAMLSLSNAKQGDFAIRSDVNKTFVLRVDGYSVLGNWQEILTPESPLGYTPLNKAGDNILGSLSFPKTSGIGIKIEDQYGWKDLIGDVAPKYGSATAPAQAVFLPNIRAWAYSANDQFECVFHIPHDYAPGTDLFVHVHWAHNGKNVTGTFKADLFATYGKGHGQQAFSTVINCPVTVNNLTIQNTPRYLHRVDEVQLSTPGGAANMLDTTQIEVDGMILISGTTTIIPSISGSDSSNRPFIFTVDVHYQSTGLTTKNKSPNFYG